MCVRAICKSFYCQEKNFLELAVSVVRICFGGKIVAIADGKVLCEKNKLNHHDYVDYSQIILAKTSH